MSLVPNRHGENFADFIQHRLAEFRLAPGAAECAAKRITADAYLTIVVDNGTVDIR